MTLHTDPNAQHAVFAPSSAHRWSVCTASAEAIAHLPEQDEGEEAAKGTAAHEEIERVLGQHNGKTLQIGSGVDALLDRDHPSAYGVALVLDYVRQLPPGTLWVEQRVALTEQIWGRCDVCHWDADTGTVTIVDYKNGYVDVQAEENEQLLIYAAASIFTHNLPAKYVRLVVVQPNSFMPVPRVKQWVTDTTQLHAFAARMAAIPGGPKEFKAGEQCKYCPMFGRCPASQDVLRDISVLICNPPDAVRPAQYALFKAMEKPIGDWFKATDKDQTKKALAGSVPPGMRLVMGTTRRTWKDDAAVRDYVVAKIGMDALDPPSPAQLEKLGVPKDEVEAMAGKPEGGPVLAFESDKRPPWVQKSATEMFGSVVPK